MIRGNSAALRWDAIQTSRNLCDCWCPGPFRVKYSTKGTSSLRSSPGSGYLFCISHYPLLSQFKLNGAQTKRPKTKRPKGQNVPRTKCPKDKTSQGTKCPKRQNVPRDKTSQRTKRPKEKNLHFNFQFFNFSAFF